MDIANHPLYPLRKALLELAEPVLVVAHPKPDGDAVGSMMAMTRYLQLAGKQAIAFMPDLPQYLAFAAEGSVKEKPADYASVVMVDVTGRERTPLKEEDFVGKTTVNVDHHVDNSCEADTRHVNPKASSACEIIWDIASLDFHDKAIAEACYLGIRSDTGNFAFPNTTAETMCIISECIEAGADFNAICTQLAKRKHSEIELVKQALNHTNWCNDGTVATTVLSRHDLRDIPEPDMQGIMTMLRSVEGAVASVALTENEDGSWRGSIRAVDGIVVNDIAAIYGGGGHPQAAGFRLEPGSDVIAELANIAEKIEQARS